MLISNHKHHQFLNVNTISIRNSDKAMFKRTKQASKRLGLFESPTLCHEVSTSFSDNTEVFTRHMTLQWFYIIKRSKK